MHQIGEYVNYSNHGICRIEDIRLMRFDYQQKEKDYYILKPVYQDKSSVFVPVDNEKLLQKMRPVLTPDEIDAIIVSVKNENMDWIDDRKLRSAYFQEVLSRRDERELLMLIACLYLKDHENEKGISSTDAQVWKKAESIIQDEFAFSLHIQSDEIGSYIRSKLALV